jgi:GT2 family glycosyltransferase
VTPRVHVVILNYNGWADTIECLESLVRSDYENMRAIVVDNASRDGSMQELLRWVTGDRAFEPPSNRHARRYTTPPVRKPIDHIVVDQHEAETLFAGNSQPTITFISSAANRGFAGGNNVALKPLLDASVDGYVCLFNNDMVIAPTAISALVHRIERESGLGAVGGVILDYTEPDVVQALGGARMTRLGTSHVYGAGSHRATLVEPDHLGYVSGGCLLTRLETLRRVGLMEEAYFLYAEDADWGERMRNHGYHFGCAIDAFTWHKGSQTTGAKSPFQDYYLVRGALMFVRKHSPAWLPAAAAYLGMRCLVPKVVRGEWERARSVMKAYADYAALEWPRTRSRTPER